MNDFISRKALIAEFKEKCNGECGCCEYNDSGFDTGEKCRLIHEAPTADVQPVKRGVWKECENGINKYCSYCNKVHGTIYNAENFCPNCGADMRGELNG